MIAMDSYLEQKATFNQAVSLQVICEDQAEVDHYWAGLSAGGAESRCGWLTDPFGVSWQIIPAAMSEWMKSSNVAGRERAFEVMLGMHKLELPTLRAAFEGRASA
jgi:predicted 3-demethylubiquinone-9 3-methyltransferase (glyoxalase superfamily)